MKVLYIGGAGRSGSTLLELILGNMDAYFSVGEIRLFWGHLRGGSRCGCGVDLQSCLCWSAVLGRLERQGLSDVSRMAALNRRINRTRDLAWLELKRQRPVSPSEHELIQGIGALYRAVWEESGRRIIVDSSKAPSQLYLLSRIPGIDLRVLHLVRDGRAVAYSWSRRRKPEPGIKRSGALMPGRSALRAMLAWSVENAFTAWMGRRLPHYSVLRYEDFVADPAARLADSLVALGFDKPDLSFLSADRLELGSTHSVGGNPVRFARHSLSIVADEEWRRGLSRWMQLVLGLIGLPLLRRFGYPIT